MTFTDLERAIELIERAILNAEPGLSESLYKIHARKIIIVNGVKHEIDIWVEFELAGGYKSVFVFETKNWKKKIGKNDIIIFSEKIKVAPAQYGFFVAKTFTRYAVAAAKLDSRVTLLKVSDEFPDGDIIGRFHNIVRDLSKAKSQVEFFGEDAEATAMIGTWTDINTAVATLDDKAINLSEYISYHIAAITEECTSKLPTNTFADGSYTYTVAKDFLVRSNTLLVNGVRVTKFHLQTTFVVEVVRPSIVSRYDVDTRGRVYTFEFVQVGGQFASQLTLVENSATGMTHALVETVPASASVQPTDS